MSTTISLKYESRMNEKVMQMLDHTPKVETIAVAQSAGQGVDLLLQDIYHGRRYNCTQQSLRSGANKY